MNAVVWLTLIIGVAAEAPYSNPKEPQPQVKHGYEYPQPKPQPQPQLQLQPRPQTQAQPEPQPQPQPQAQPQPQPQPTLQPQPQAQTGYNYKPPIDVNNPPIDLRSDLSKSSPTSQTTTVSEPQPTDQPEPQTSPQPLRSFDTPQPTPETEEVSILSTSHSLPESPEPTPTIPAPEPQSILQSSPIYVPPQPTSQPQLQTNLPPRLGLQSISQNQAISQRQPLPLNTHVSSIPPILLLSPLIPQSQPQYQTPLYNQQGYQHHQQQSQQFSSQGFQQEQYNTQFALQPTISSNGQLSSYQADSNEYTSQAQLYNEVLDEAIISRVLDVLKEDEQRLGKYNGNQMSIEGLSLNRVQPSIEVLSFVRNSPLKLLSSGQNSLSQGSTSSAYEDFSLSSGSQSIASSSNLGFLPRTPPVPIYGVPN